MTRSFTLLATVFLATSALAQPNSKADQSCGCNKILAKEFLTTITNSKFSDEKKILTSFWRQFSFDEAKKILEDNYNYESEGKYLEVIGGSMDASASFNEETYNKTIRENVKKYNLNTRFLRDEYYYFNGFSENITTAWVECLKIQRENGGCDNDETQLAKKFIELNRVENTFIMNLRMNRSHDDNSFKINKIRRVNLEPKVTKEGDNGGFIEGESFNRTADFYTKRAYNLIDTNKMGVLFLDVKGEGTIDFVVPALRKVELFKEEELFKNELCYEPGSITNFKSFFSTHSGVGDGLPSALTNGFYILDICKEANQKYYLLCWKRPDMSVEVGQFIGFWIRESDFNEYFFVSYCPKKFKVGHPGFAVFKVTGTPYKRDVPSDLEPLPYNEFLKPNHPYANFYVYKQISTPYPFEKFNEVSKKWNKKGISVGSLNDESLPKSSCD